MVAVRPLGQPRDRAAWLTPPAVAARMPGMYWTDEPRASPPPPRHSLLAASIARVVHRAGSRANRGAGRARTPRNSARSSATSRRSSATRAPALRDGRMQQQEYEGWLRVAARVLSRIPADPDHLDRSGDRERAGGRACGADRNHRRAVSMPCRPSGVPPRVAVHDACEAEGVPVVGEGFTRRLTCPPKRRRRPTRVDRLPLECRFDVTAPARWASGSAWSSR